jgi:hypothetical protein
MRLRRHYGSVPIPALSATIFVVSKTFAYIRAKVFFNNRNTREREMTWK